MKLTRFLVCTLALFLSGGCVSPSPHFDGQVGLAVNTAKARQTLNPDASRNADPVAGIGGTPAAFAIGEYHNSFKAPPPTFQVIGGSTGQ
ncbi:MAG TPA: hypothetical protein VFT23_14605 [Burkholderiales bacterium]|nr:hypothetical protein [Burkholderiales bacterium]